MSRVGNWLMEMEEEAFSLLSTYRADEARKLFLMKYPGNEHVFDNCLMMDDGPNDEAA